MATTFRAEDVGFLATAPRVLEFSHDVRAVPEVIFDALVADPASWTGWFPGLRDGRYADPAARGVGAHREVAVTGMGRLAETVMAFERPARWIYRVDRASLPIARALMEEWTLDGRGDVTTVRWRFAIDPTPAFGLAMRVGSSAMGRTFHRAMRNLERRLAG